MYLVSTLIVVLVLPLILSIFGFVCLAIAERKPNLFVGFRTRRSYASQEAWTYANHTFGLFSIIINIPVTLILALVLIFYFGSYATMNVYIVLLLIFLEIAINVPSFIIIQNHLKQEFAKK